MEIYEKKSIEDVQTIFANIDILKERLLKEKENPKKIEELQNSIDAFYIMLEFLYILNDGNFGEKFI